MAGTRARRPPPGAPAGGGRHAPPPRGASGALGRRRAGRVPERGAPSRVLRLEDVDTPVPGEGQLLVRVRAAALNFPDVLMAAGLYQERPPPAPTPRGGVR